ncbi:MAG: pilin [Clostridia bacterium]
MKKLTTNKIFQKIILTLIMIVSLCFITPQRAYADAWSSLGGSLLKEVMQLVSALGDVTMGFLNNVMLGANLGSAMISEDDQNLSNKDSWLYYDGNEFTKEFKDGEIDTNSFITLPGEKAFEVPNMLYCPENIFANNIAALDVNFLSPNKFTSAVQGVDKANDKAKSSAEVLRTTISSWYKSFRSIAVVGLLSVLIYLGIRILLSSAADDKAKYKESLKDWLVALCLVFVIHFIMSGILMLTDKVTNLFSTSITNGITVSAEDGSNTVKFRTNLMGLVRFQAQSDDAQTTCAYTIMYVALVIYTVIFTFLYYKRFLYTAFFTMIAPLVALTYPIDKIGDGKAQAFNMWFKEYTMNVIIQPVHLILYTVFVSSAIDLAADNPLYALVAIGFLIPAEKFIKKMFRLDRAETTSGFGSFAGGALAMSGLKKLAGIGSNSSRGNAGKGGNSGSDDSGSANDGKIFMPTGSAGKLGTFEKGNNIVNDKPTSDGGLNTNLFNDPNETEQSRFDAQNEYDKLREKEEADKQREMNKEAIENLDNNQLSNDELRSIAMNPNNPFEDRSQKAKELSRSKHVGMGKEFRKGFNNNKVIKGVKAVGKGVWKNKQRIARGVGIGMGATIGLAAGLTTGDLSKAATYASAGAYAGNAFGKNATNFAVNKGTQLGEFAKGKYDKAVNKSREDLYGRSAAKQMRIEDENRKARKRFLESKEQKAKWEDKAADIGYDGDMEQFMNSVADYHEAGITDEKQIMNALKVEKEKGGVGGFSHEQIVDMAAYANKGGYGKEYIEDEKKRNTMEIQLATAGLSQSGQIKAMETFAALHGKEDYYKKVSKLYPGNSAQKTQGEQEQPKIPETPKKPKGLK